MATSTSSTTARPITTAAATTIRLPEYQKEEYTIAGMVLKFFEDKAKDVGKALGYTAFWLGESIPGLPPQVQTFSRTMGDFKNFVSATEVPKKTAELLEALANTRAPVERLYADMTNATGTWGQVGTTAHVVGEAVRTAFEKTTLLINAVVDGIDFGARFVPLDATFKTWMQGINFAATLGGSGSSAIKEVENISKTTEADGHKRTLYVMNLAKYVSYVALGAIGLAFVLTATPILPWTMVACLTSGLTFTIGGYFYEKVYDPEGKGKNLNPEVIIKNNLLRKDYEQRLARV